MSDPPRDSSDDSPERAGVVVSSQTVSLHGPAAPNREPAAGRSEADAAVGAPPFGADYEVMNELGRGGMGIVYKARDRRLGRFVCLKVLPPDSLYSLDRLRRFEREARAISSINHPNICTLHELGESAGRPYLVLEWIEGQTLRVLSERDSDAGRLMAVAAQVARALAVAHAAGVVHRDIKPDNIMVRPDGIAKVLDFGLARLMERESENVSATEAGLVMGTVRYMSPEQARGEPVERASDVFSLGVVLYELATGRHPFEGPSTARILAAIESEEPRPPREWRQEIAPELEALILGMLQKRPETRPSAAEVADALGAMALPAALPLLRAPASRPPATTDAPSKNAPAAPARWWVAAVVLASALAALLVWWLGRDAEPAQVSTPTLAVLPFTSSGADGGSYLGDGVSEDIIAMLARAPELSVVSRSSSFAYKASGDVRDIGKALGVDYVLEGSVKKEGPKVRIVAQLVDARTGMDVWSERFDEASEDPWALQDEVTGRIVAALTGELGQIKRMQYRQSWGTDSTNLAEYDYYLRGHERYMRFTFADNEEALRLWREGLAVFPESPLLQVKSGFAHFMRVYLYLAGDPATDYARAGELARAALAHEDLSPLERRLAHWLMAYVSAQERDYERAVREAEATIALAPYDAFQLGDLSSVLILAGRIERALQWLDKAMANDPANLPFYRQLRGWALTVGGRYAESVPELEGSIELVAVPVLQAVNYARLGRPEEAKTQVKQALALEPRLTRDRWAAANFYADAAVLEGQLRDLAAAGLP